MKALLYMSYNPDCLCLFVVPGRFELIVIATDELETLELQFYLALLVYVDVYFRVFSLHFLFVISSNRCPDSRSLAVEPGPASSADSRSPRGDAEDLREGECPSSLRYAPARLVLC